MAASSRAATHREEVFFWPAAPRERVLQDGPQARCFLRADVGNRAGTPPEPTSWRWLMLVLTRRVGETTVIDGDIEVTVVSVSGGRVRLGIKAPPYIRVNRLEIEQELEALEVGAGKETRPTERWQPP